MSFVYLIHCGRCSAAVKNFAPKKAEYQKKSVLNKKKMGVNDVKNMKNSEKIRGPPGDL